MDSKIHRHAPLVRFNQKPGISKTVYVILYSHGIPGMLLWKGRIHVELNALTQFLKEVNGDLGGSLVNSVTYAGCNTYQPPKRVKVAKKRKNFKVVTLKDADTHIGFIHHLFEHSVCLRRKADYHKMDRCDIVTLKQ